MGKNEEMINEVETEVTDVKVAEETSEVTEKHRFVTKIGTGIGKFAAGAKKVVTSKPAKIVGGVAAVGLALAAGYKAGRDGFPHGNDNELDDADDAIDVESSEVSED